MTVDQGQVTIVGVIVGVLLGGITQVVAGTVEHHRDRKREDLALRRQAYVDIISATDAEAEAKRAAISYIADPQEIPLADIEVRYQRYVQAYLRRVDAMTRIALFAPEPIQHLVDVLTDALDGRGWEVDLTRLVDLQYQALSMMRRDLGLPGDAIRPAPPLEEDEAIKADGASTSAGS